MPSEPCTLSYPPHCVFPHTTQCLCAFLLFVLFSIYNDTDCAESLALQKLKRVQCQHPTTPSTPLNYKSSSEERISRGTEKG